MIRCTKFSPVERGALLGFADLVLDSGLTIHDCTLMESNGRKWVGLPDKAQVNADKTVRTDPATGKTLYVPVISIPDKTRRELFSNNALLAIEAFRGGSEAAPRPAPLPLSPAAKASHAVNRPFDDPLPL